MLGDNLIWGIERVENKDEETFDVPPEASVFTDEARQPERPTEEYLKTVFCSIMKIKTKDLPEGLTRHVIDEVTTDRHQGSGLKKTNPSDKDLKLLENIPDKEKEERRRANMHLNKKVAISVTKKDEKLNDKQEQVEEDGQKKKNLRKVKLPAWKPPADSMKDLIIPQPFAEERLMKILKDIGVDVENSDDRLGYPRK